MILLLLKKYINIKNNFHQKKRDSAMNLSFFLYQIYQILYYCFKYCFFDIILHYIRITLISKKMKKIFVLLLGLFCFSKSFAQLPPAPPTGLSGTQNGLTNSINLTWTASGTPTVAGYKIYYKIIGSTQNDSSKIGISTSATLNNLTSNVTYRIFMKSFRLNVSDTIRSVKSDSIDILLVSLVAPTATIESITHNSLVVSINDTNPLETGYQIELTENGNTTTVNQESLNPFVTVNGLKPKTTYSIRVRSKRNSLFGPWSPNYSATTKKDFPPSPSATYDSNCPESIHLTWTIANRQEDIDNFIVQKSYDNATFYELAKPSAATRDFYDITSIPGKTQYYRIYSFNTTGVTQSNIVSVTAKSYVAPNIALNPISDQSNKSNNHLTIRWTNGSEDQVCKTNIRSEMVIRVRLNNSGEFTDYSRTYPFTSNIKIENLKPKTIVEVGILSVSDKGIASPMVTVKDTTAGPPYPPSDAIAVLYYDAIGVPVLEVSYKDNSKDEDYFIIERSTDNKNFTQLGKIKFDLTKFKDANLEEGVLYYYRVKAGSTTEGDSEYSPVIGPFIAQYSKAPNAPYGLKAKQNGAKVNLTWYDDSIREESYIIEKSLDEGLTFSLVATLGKNVTAYTDENVTGGKSYIYRAKAVNTIGTSAYSNLETIKISGTGLIEDKLNANVYPNPAFESLNIETANLKVDRELTLKVYDRNNRQVLTKIFKSSGIDLFELPISNLGQGMYNVVITDGETSISKKVFKY